VKRRALKPDGAALGGVVEWSQNTFQDCGGFGFQFGEGEEFFAEVLEGGAEVAGRQ